MANSSYKKASLRERATTCSNPLTRKLLEIIIEKKTNLCLAADVDDAGQLLHLAKLVGPHICVLKVHHDHYDNFRAIRDDLVALARMYNFLLFNDAKYADIAETVRRKYKATSASWADLVTVHALYKSNEMLRAIEEVVREQQEPRGVLLLCEMSCENDFYHPNKIVSALKVAKDNKQIVVGVIAQELPIEDDHLVKLTPGVHLTATGDNRNQVYRTPESVCLAGTDIVIVGRGITTAPDDEAKLSITLEYKKRCYEGLMESLLP